MADGNEGTLRLCVRVDPENPDPRHQALLGWYEELPSTRGGKKVALQERILDLLYQALASEGDSSRPPVTPKPSPHSTSGGEGQRNVSGQFKKSTGTATSSDSRKAAKDAADKKKGSEPSEAARVTMAGIDF